MTWFIIGIAAGIGGTLWVQRERHRIAYTVLRWLGVDGRRGTGQSDDRPHHGPRIVDI
ncbi:MAG: hypothetical protein ABIK09_19725 [Pseudomonadota bacterium]